MSLTLARFESVGRTVNPGVDDLATLRPELVASWNYDKNLELSPNQIGAGSSKSVWWRCPKGHDWQAIVSNRAKGAGCPICAGKQVQTGFNDLKSQNPLLASQWNLKRNKTLTAEQISPSSNKVVWWVCQQGHEWEASPNARSKGRGCPVCSNKSIRIGINDLATTHPDLAVQFAADLNSGLAPTDLVAGSNKTIWWRCDKDHSWKNSVNNRSRGQGCPYCSGRMATQGTNDLATLKPQLAKEWNSDRNGSVSASTVSPKSGKKYWWTCERNHEWKASVQDRWDGNGCPYCGGKKALAGFNDLGYLRPDLANEIFINGQNINIAQTITIGSSKKLDWLCAQGHVYQAVVYKRVNGQGCPYCSNAKVLAGFNDIESQYPEIASQIHSEKNPPGIGKTLVGKSNKKIWWKCPEGHEWQTTPEHRLRGRGCPVCAVTGFAPNKAGYFYFIENKELAARKVGIANLGSERLQDFKRLGWSAIQVWNLEDGYLIQELETQMLRWIRRDLGLPVFLDKKAMGKPAGWSETFPDDSPSNLEIINKIEHLISELRPRF